MNFRNSHLQDLKRGRVIHSTVATEFRKSKTGNGVVSINKLHTVLSTL